MIEWLDKPYVEHMKTPCPNASGRMGYVVNCIGLHFTKGLGYKGTAKWAGDPEAKGSAHFYIGRKGEVLQRVPLYLRAWHFGQSKLEYNRQGEILYPVTDYCAVGIEIANCGHMFRAEHGDFYFTFGDNPRRYPIEKYPTPIKAEREYRNGRKVEFYWEPYSAETIFWVAELCADLIELYDIPLTRVLGHEDVAQPLGKRKYDPGPLWPWKSFMEMLQSRLGVTMPEDLWRLHKTVES